MTNFIENNFIISMHYRNGVVTCSFNDVSELFDIHTSFRKVEGFQDALMYYIAYKEWIHNNSYGLIVANMAKFYDVSIEGKRMQQVMDEVIEIQHNILKEME